MKRLVPLFLSAALILSLLSACGSPGAEITLVPPEGTQEATAAQPTGGPTLEPSLALPSEEPAAEPSAEPAQEPSAEPSQAPAAQPPATQAPTPEPTQEPTPEPTPAPAPEPTPEPTAAPAAGVDLAAFYEDIVFDDVEFSASAEVTGEYLEYYYPGLSAIAVKQQVIYIPMITAVVCEIALVEVEDSADIAAVKAIFQARIDYQVGDGDSPGGAWYPASIEDWQNNSRIVSHGNYIMMIAYDKCDDIVARFNALF